MSACLEGFVAAPCAPWMAGSWRVTWAAYSPGTIALTRVVAVKPSICAPAATGLVTVQVRLGVFGTSNGNTDYHETRAFLTVGYRPAAVTGDLPGS